MKISKIFFKKLLLTTSFFIFTSFRPVLADEITTSSTMSELNSIIQSLELKLLLETPPELQSNVIGANFFSSLNSYIDLNVIGAGKKVVLNQDQMLTFVIDKLKEGKTPINISVLLVEEFKKGSFSQNTNDTDNSFNKPQQLIKNNFGGFVVGEMEYHQEPDGIFHPLIELNQARIFFSSQVTPSGDSNKVYFLGEWNPIPEESVHQIDKFEFDFNGKKQLVQVPNITLEDGYKIPFEQLYISLKDIGKTGFDITFGQFRNPFGLWSDYTSHRNFNSAKNNMLVNGFALKKIELGLLLEKHFNLTDSSNIDFQGAIVHGRKSRTSPLSREDQDDKKDFVSTLEYNSDIFNIGTSAYLGELTLQRNFAYGFNFMIPTKYVSLSGEYVYAQNNNINETFNTKLDYNIAFSHSAYLQFDYHLQDTFEFLNNAFILALTKDLHLYGLYDFWSYYADGKIVNHPAYKVFHGLRHQLNNNTRWTIIEFGRMFNDSFDKGEIHISTQLEFTF